MPLVSVKNADPRYEVDDGRRTPPFYVTEVESARQRILHFLEHSESPLICGKRHSSLTSMGTETRDFGLSAPRQLAKRNSNDSTFSRNVSYCFNVKQQTPSLALMPVHPHGICLVEKHSNN